MATTNTHNEMKNLLQQSEQTNTATTHGTPAPSKHNELLHILASKQEANDNQYQSQLNHDKDDIIDQFGGLHNILHLYLTNTMDETVTNNLYTHFTNHQTISDKSNDIANEINYQNIRIHRQLTVVNIQKSDDKTISIPSLKTQRSAFFPEVLKVDMNDNTYFRIFKSKKQANHCVHNVVHSKYMNIAIGIILCLVVLLPGFCILNNGTAFCVDSAPWFFYVVVPLLTLYLMLHIMALNYQLVRHTVKTFDFAFKTYNIIIILIAIPVVMAESLSFTAVFEIMMIVSFVPGVFIDALFVEEKTKIILTTGFIAAIMIGMANIYFTYEDVFWDPFDDSFGANRTLISFKSSAINALSNLILILVKSLTTAIMSRIHQKRKPNGKSAVLTRDGYRKSSVLLNRPYVQWIEGNKANTNDADGKEDNDL